MKKIIALLIAVLLVLGLTACGGGAESAEENAAETTESSSEETAAEEPQTDTGVLVVYFSATGTTKGVAEKIASVTGADLYEIKAAQEYTAEDLDWNDSDSRTTHEQNDPAVRPRKRSGLARRLFDHLHRISYLVGRGAAHNGYFCGEL